VNETTGPTPEANPENQDLFWWYSLATGAVEYGLKSPAKDRIGPFASEAEASQALEVVRARAEAWRQQDAEDN
jgi:hypothetical protein